MDDNKDFVTLMPTIRPDLFLVAVMTWNTMDEEYVARKYSEKALHKQQAMSLAQSWAAALQVEVR